MRGLQVKDLTCLPSDLFPFSNVSWWLHEAAEHHRIVQEFIDLSLSGKLDDVHNRLHVGPDHPYGQALDLAKAFVQNHRDPQLKSQFLAKIHRFVHSHGAITMQDFFNAYDNDPQRKKIRNSTI